MRLAVDGEGRAGLRAHRSHEVLPIADCPLTPSGTLLPVLEERFAAGGEVEVAVDADGVRHVADRPQRGGARGRPQRGGARGRPQRGGARGRARRSGSARRGGSGSCRPGTFWQVHPALADALAQVVGEWAQAPAGGVAWDLYGGVGLFAAVLADQVGRDGTVAVVESARRAVADGRAALADLPQVDWRTGRVEHVLRVAARAPGRRGRRPAAPRARPGAGRGAVRPARPAVSCTSPATPRPWPATSRCSRRTATAWRPCGRSTPSR